jgi:hypothetical protein
VADAVTEAVDLSPIFAVRNRLTFLTVGLTVFKE